MIPAAVEALGPQASGAQAPHLAPALLMGTCEARERPPSLLCHRCPHSQWVTCPCGLRPTVALQPAPWNPWPLLASPPLSPRPAQLCQQGPSPLKRWLSGATACLPHKDFHPPSPGAGPRSAGCRRHYERPSYQHTHPEPLRPSLAHARAAAVLRPEPTGASHIPHRIDAGSSLGLYLVLKLTKSCGLRRGDQQPVTRLSPSRCSPDVGRG